MQSAYSFICAADLEEAKLVFILGVAWGFLYVSLMEGERERDTERGETHTERKRKRAR